MSPQRLNSVFGADNHAALLECWQFYQDTIAAYAAHPSKGKKLMGRLIDTLAGTIPDELNELRSRRTTFQRRRPITWPFSIIWEPRTGLRK